MAPKRTRSELLKDKEHPYYYRPLKDMIDAGLLLNEDGTVVQPLTGYGTNYLDNLSPWILHTFDVAHNYSGTTSCGCYIAPIENTRSNNG